MIFYILPLQDAKYNYWLIMHACQCVGSIEHSRGARDCDQQKHVPLQRYYTFNSVADHCAQIMFFRIFESNSAHVHVQMKWTSLSRLQTWGHSIKLYG